MKTKKALAVILGMLISIICCLFLQIGFERIDAAAEDEVRFESAGLAYSVNNSGEATIIGVIEDKHYDEDGNFDFEDRCMYTNSKIPASIDGHPVKKIGDYAFSECINLQSAKLPDSITWIGVGAFSGCTALKSVNIPSSMETHGYTGERAYPGQFNGCTSLKTIEFGYGIKKIPQGLFCHCDGIEEITIPSTVTSIERWAFMDCANLKRINLPEGLESIGWYAFDYDQVLTDVKLPKSLQFLDCGAFCDCISLKSITIPAATSTNGYAGERAYPSPFVGCSNLSSVSFEKGVDRIPGGFFFGCNGLKEIVIPDTVKTIERWAFMSCENLKKVVLPEGLESIGWYAFDGDEALTDIQLPKTLSYLDCGAFCDCVSLKSITIPAATSTNGYAGERAYPGPFVGCSNLSAVSFEKGVDRIPGGFFFGCNGLKEIVIPDTVKFIERWAFMSCENLKKVVLPEGLESIGWYAFDGDEALSDIHLPKSLSYLDRGVFNECSSIKSITIPALVTSIKTGTFNGCKSLSQVTLEEGLNVIEYAAISGCTSLKELSLPKSLTTVGDRVFSGCTKLEYVVALENLKDIDDEAFEELSKNFYIKGYSGTRIETFAKEHGIKFVPMNSIKLNASSLSLYEGDTKTLKATTTSKVEKVTWSTSKKSVAKVNSKGKITAINAGKCKITVKSGTSKKTCVVKVVKPTVSLNPSNVTFYNEQTQKLKAKLKGVSGKVVWDSNKDKIATVKNGKITASKSKTGSCKITATITKKVDGKERTYKGVCKVTVKKPTIKLYDVNLSLYVQQTHKLKATVKGKSTSITWNSTDNDVAKVGKDGTVTAIGTGNCTITAKANGVVASCKVKVVKREKQTIELTSSALSYNRKTKTYSMQGSTKPQSLGIKIKGSGGYTVVVKNKENNRADAFYNGGDMITAPYSGTIYVIVTTKETAKYPKLSKTFTINVSGFPLIRDEKGEWDYFQNNDGTVTIAGYTGSSKNPIIPASFKIGLSIQPVTAIADKAFYNSHISSLSLDISGYNNEDDILLKSIGNYAFYNCTKLKKIYFLDLITSIGEGAFYGCSSLERLDLSNDIKIIPKNAFKNCTSITGMIDFPVALRTIGESAFAGCSNLLRIHLHQNLTSIEKDAFLGCDRLKRVYYSGPKSSFDVITGIDQINTIKTTLFYNSGLSGQSSLTDEQLFRDYPTFLNNQSYESITDGIEAEIARILANQTASDEWWSTLKSQFTSFGAYGIKQWFESSSEITWTEDKMNEKLAVELLKYNFEDTTNSYLDDYYNKEYYETTKSMYKIIKDFKSFGDQIFSDGDTRWKLARELNQIDSGTIADASEINEALKTLGENWKDVKNEVKAAGKVVDAADFLISYLKICEIGETRIMALLDIIPDDCGLFTGLSRARNLLDDPFSKELIDQFMDYCMNEIVEVITSFVEEGIEILRGKHVLSSGHYMFIAKLFYKLCGTAMNIPSIEDQQNAWLVLCNTMTLHNVASNHRISIIDQGGTVDEKEKGKYQIATSVYLSSLKQAVPYVAKIEGHAFGPSESNRPLKTFLKKYQDVLNWEAFVKSCKANAQGL